MGVLLCKPGDGVWMAHENAKQPERLPCPFEWPCVPCASAACCAVCCMKSRECLCTERRTGRTVSRMACVPGVSGMQFSACGRYLYQLSSEADCIHTCASATGELLYAAPVGVFPRCMKTGEGGRMLLCAGGAANEAVLMNAPDLTHLRTVYTRHPCFAADFWCEGLVLVCAAEGEDIRSVVCTLPPKALRPRELAELPGPPAWLCVCPDGKTALISTRGGLAKMDLYTGSLLWNCPEWALCMRMECMGNEALISDTLDGSVWVFNHHRPWERRLIAHSPDSQACFLC